MAGKIFVPLMRWLHVTNTALARVFGFLLMAYFAAAAFPAVCAAPSGQAFSLKPDEELDLSYELEMHRRVNLRICKDYLSIDLPDHQMVILSQAPDWRVRAISPVRKLTGVSTCQDWVRRGSPLNFLKVTSIPEWPLVRTGIRPFLNWNATCYALPYKTQNGAIVPVSRGNVGDFLVLGEGFFPKQPCQIVATLIQTPKSVAALPLQLNLWDTDKMSSKMNSLFLYSGVNNGGPKAMEAKKIAVVKRHSLPSYQGYKECKDPRDVWVSHADVEGFEGLLR
ncbi:MAG: hypothetical protein JST44_22125 [Cyanobacteria bacterium SZAS LIN-5]|nr:hypothetical protein [Cyanobacteria bacterium SZAS LIN-5]